MSLFDILLALGIISLSLYILYRSVWKKKGHCPGCGGNCGMEKPKKTE